MGAIYFLVGKQQGSLNRTKNPLRSSRIDRRFTLPTCMPARILIFIAVDYGVQHNFGTASFPQSTNHRHKPPYKHLYFVIYFLYIHWYIAPYILHTFISSNPHKHLLELYQQAIKIKKHRLNE